MQRRELSESEWNRFEQEGFLALGQVATDVQLAGLQERMDAIMLGAVRYEGMYFQLDSESGVYADAPAGGLWAGPTLHYRKIQMLERDPLFLEYLQNPLFHAICRAVYGEDVSVFRSMFMNKPAHRGTVLPYHQDGGTQWGIDRNPLITVWTALDDATIANGCMQVIPGSHKLGLLSEFGHTITEAQEAEFAKEERSIFLEAKAGEAFLLHNWLLHRSGVNGTPQPRRAFAVCYMDSATRSVRDADYRFPAVFGAGALRAEEMRPDFCAVGAEASGE